MHLRLDCSHRHVLEALKLAKFELFGWVIHQSFSNVFLSKVTKYRVFFNDRHIYFPSFDYSILGNFGQCTVTFSVCNPLLFDRARPLLAALDTLAFPAFGLHWTFYFFPELIVTWMIKIGRVLFIHLVLLCLQNAICFPDLVFC